MLDIKILRVERETLRRNIEDRGAPIFDDLGRDASEWAERSVARLEELDERYRQLLQGQEQLRQRQNENASAMRAVGHRPKAEQAAARAPIIEEGRQLRDRERDLKEQADAALLARDRAWARVANMTHPDSPRGWTDDDHRVVRTWGTPRTQAHFGFTPKDHLELCEALDLADFSAGAKVAGQKFYFLKNDAVLLDMALQRYALDVAREHGFVLHTTPDVAREEIVSGLGFSPRGESSQVYAVENTDLCLVGTAEITLGGMLADTIIEEEQLPVLIAGLSHCFRKEAGASGQDAKGLYRVHQFTKVELFAFTAGDLAVSEAMHAKLLAIEEQLFQSLELPYRVLDIASGDLGAPAYRKYDIEAWMPGRNEWGEVTSTSNCSDYQARRLKIRYRPTIGDGSTKVKNRFVHTLNGTAVATSRAIVAILEAHQKADGSVSVPKVLRPYMGCDVLNRR